MTFNAGNENALNIADTARATGIQRGNAMCCEVAAQGTLASYPGRLGGEKRPGIDCLCMRGQFRYISVKL